MLRADWSATRLEIDTCCETLELPPIQLNCGDFFFFFFFKRAENWHSTKNGNKRGDAKAPINLGTHFDELFVLSLSLSLSGDSGENARGRDTRFLCMPWSSCSIAAGARFFFIFLVSPLFFQNTWNIYIYSTTFSRSNIRDETETFLLNAI